MRIGVYGGSFNPPHLGHLAAARAVVEALKLDKLFFIPAGTPPHKDLSPGSPTPEQRLELTRLAGEHLNMGDTVETLDLEIRRGGKSYTADTLKELKALYPDDELWLLVGTDMFLTLQSWYHPEEILALAGIAAFGRTAEDTDESFSEQRAALYTAWPDAKIYTLTIPGVLEVSSTEVRAALRLGEGDDKLPPAVYGAILRWGLYDTGADVKHLSISQLRPAALSYLKHRRIPHVLGTEQEAVRLAIRYGADPVKAQRAALLHDCTKRLEMEEQLALCEQYHIELDEVERHALKLLHARTGAAVAADVFGEDEEVVSAIRWHTTGRADMTVLEKILYIADYIEPSRDFPGVEDLRRCAYEDLDRGVLMGLSMTVRELEARGAPVHHTTLSARDHLMKG